MEGKDQPILHNQCHGGWCPGDARSQGISSHSIGVVCPDYSGFSTRREMHDTASDTTYSGSRSCTSRGCVHCRSSCISVWRNDDRPTSDVACFHTSVWRQTVYLQMSGDCWVWGSRGLWNKCGCDYVWPSRNLGKGFGHWWRVSFPFGDNRASLLARGDIPCSGDGLALDVAADGMVSVYKMAVGKHCGCPWVHRYFLWAALDPLHAWHHDMMLGCGVRKDWLTFPWRQQSCTTLNVRYNNHRSRSSRKNYNPWIGTSWVMCHPESNPDRVLLSCGGPVGLVKAGWYSQTGEVATDLASRALKVGTRCRTALSRVSLG